MSITTTSSSAELTAVDFAVVRQLHAEVAERMTLERRRRADTDLPAMGDADERMLAESLIRQSVREAKQSALDSGRGVGNEVALHEAVRAALFGMGRLQALIEDQTLSDIDINGHDDVWLSTLDGRKRRGPAVAESDEDLVELVRNVATYQGLSSRPFDPANPSLEMRLPDRSRLTALMSVTQRPSICIRLFRMRTVRLVDLHALEMFTDQVGAFLTASVRARKNLLVVGETGAGKTTFTRALANEIPSGERVITVEHFLELGLPRDLHPDMVELEERPANAEGLGAVSMEDLVRRTRRMNPDRVILGESIGPEIVALLDAMTQGNDGGMSTIHGSSARSAIDKIALYAAMAPRPLTMQAAHMLTAIGLDLLVHIKKTRLGDGRIHRHVASIVEVGSFNGQEVTTSELFHAPAGTVFAHPKATLSEQLREDLLDAGYDDTEWAEQ